MQYQNVCLESFGYTLPDDIVSTEELENRLSPLYERLRLPTGRLELMTGIRERRFWKPGTKPSEKSIESASKALSDAKIENDLIGALVHGSVCRDHLEPATACRVHHQLGLSKECMLYDTSNACLGLLNGIIQVANMIELGQIRAGLVVGTEGGRDLVENTIDTLNRDQTLTRNDIKLAIASLTIGSASCAILLCDRELSQTGNHLFAATARSNTEHHNLCRSIQDSLVVDNSKPLMSTDSERLMHEGVAMGIETYQAFLNDTQWTHDEIDKVFCHQVGPTHRKMMFEGLGIYSAIDYPTVEWLGNTGAVALPVSMALGIENGHLERGDQVAMLGIGSGINCLMLGVRWEKSLSTKRIDASHSEEFGVHSREAIITTKQ